LHLVLVIVVGSRHLCTIGFLCVARIADYARGKSMSDMLQAGTIVHSRYRIVRLIGKGGMGAVYEAVDQTFNSTIALKQMFPTPNLGQNQIATVEKAFQREAQILHQLRHSSLPRVTDYFSDTNGRFLVMDFIEGDNLLTHLEACMQAEGRPLTEHEVVPWAIQVLKALEYLHKRQPPVIHRDIKPHNITLTADGEIFLLDFGIAKGISSTTTVSGHSSVYAYTIAYAPLEQIEGTGTSPRSDLFSLAATMYHLLTGVSLDHPPRCDALTRASAKIRNQPDPLSPPAEVSQPVQAVLMQALALDPDMRPASATDMRRMLEDAISGQVPTVNTGATIATRPPLTPAATMPMNPPHPPPATPPTPPAPSLPPQPTPSVAPQQQRSWAARYWWAIILAIVVVLGGGGMLLSGGTTEGSGGVASSTATATSKPTAIPKPTATATPKLIATPKILATPTVPKPTAIPTILEIGIKGEELAFDTDFLDATIAEGEALTVVFENTSQTQEHSWVLLNHNDMDRADAFNDAAANFVDANYIPIHDAALMDMVLAYSPAIQPGERNTITFPAPPPGEYLYICTVPGHFAAGDYGVLTIHPDMADVDVILEIGIKGEELAFDTDFLDATIAEGEKMAVEFQNSSQTQEHSWVLLNHDDLDQAGAFSDVAMRSVDTGYMPLNDPVLMDTVIAYSPTLQPGESNTITFSAPPPGEYLYICTVPGHFAAGDWGTLTISAP
jgi:serine/threonine protein kinase